MTGRFDGFILLAEMRTGSNFLEDTLNLVPGLRCWGEAFNPHFVGHAKKTEMAGVTMQAREADPMALLSAIRAKTQGLAGFRFFHDHDPRILRHCLADPRCAKVVLTRNPLDSYVSLEIARQTNQWRLGDLKQARTAQMTFDADHFARHLDRVQAFQQEILRALQVSGQTAFYIGYDDINDLEIVNGLLAFLGVAGRLDQLSGKTKVQNPGALRDKVANYEVMERALSSIDHFGLHRTPNFEPRRGAGVPGFVRAAKAPLLFMPVRGGPSARVAAWLAALDGTPPQTGDMTQKDLRKWKRQHPGHRSFTVIRHPVARIHDTFRRHILSTGPESFADIRETLRTQYAVPLPEGEPGPDFGPNEHRSAFLAFLAFVKGNLGNQTSIRVDPSWASQSVVLQGMAQVMLPDAVLREERLADGLAALAAEVGLAAPHPGPAEQDATLSLIHDDAVESAVRYVYQKDYMMFGFRGWA
ncbi:nodulation protein NodH [Oceaniglobus roseus]|uniref:nodulation protein NodH n=1 Tax=Oceaniglobus roseus TaxID=1737570 RepID=UPI000C7F08EE|nr:nodulation protein NodH [Kandeliimicrobium roseum]